MPIQTERMFSDRDWSGEAYQPATQGVIVQGNRGRLFAKVCRPGGSPGPWPTILFCHGIPGIESLADFMTDLRQAGFCTVQFHYSGNWGCDGEYAISHCLQDTDTMVDWILRNEGGLFDVNNLFIVGHSLGGLTAAAALARRENLKAGALIMPFNPGDLYRSAQSDPEALPAVKAFFDGCGSWVKGFSWESFRREAAAEDSRFCLASYADGLAHKPVLTVAGTMDVLLPRDKHLDVLLTAMHAAGADRLTELTVPTDHSMDDQRGTIKKAIAGFFARYVR